MRKMSMIWLTVALALPSASCGGSRMTRTHVDAQRVGHPIKNVLIIAIIDDQKIREIFETHFMDRLNAVGVQATSSAHVLPVSVASKLNNEEIARLVE